MTTDEARELVIGGINYAAYRETDSSLHDSDKNRLFGLEHYKSDRSITQPSPWAEGDFEEKMAMLLRWANALNRSVPAFQDAQRLLEREDSVIGHVIRRAQTSEQKNLPAALLRRSLVNFKPEFFRTLLESVLQITGLLPARTSQSSVCIAVCSGV